MPRPNKNAPTRPATPTGATEPRSVTPSTGPRIASNGMKTTHAIASISICARTPALRRSETNTRHADVKPKAA